MTLGTLPLTDALALGCFVACWFGYGLAASVLTRKRASLISTVGIFRERWMARVCERDNHVADAALLSNLLRGALFFASTTVFILGGLLAVLGTGGAKVAEAVGQLPYVARTDAWLLETKAIVLILMFVYAFFKFTWSAWQYNVLSILVGAAPHPTADREEIRIFARSAADIATQAGESYNIGIRAYYFSIALMTWFFDPLVFLFVTLVVAFVMYRREFASPMLASLKAATGCEQQG